MRKQEVLGLRWSDVDLDNGRVSIRKTWTMVGGKPRTGEPKTKFAWRTIELDAVTVSVLRGHRKAQLEERMLAGTGWVEGDLSVPLGRRAPALP